MSRLTYLKRSLQHQTILQQTQQAESDQGLVESRRIQEETERRFQESQEADRLKALVKEQERAALLAAQEEEEKKKQEEGLRLERLTKTFLEEPVGDVCTLRLQLPDGKKLTRRFLTTDTIGSVLDYLFLHFHQQDESSCANLSLNQNFPKNTFTKEKADLSLKDAGLCPKAALYVQDCDK